MRANAVGLIMGSLLASGHAGAQAGVQAAPAVKVALVDAPGLPEFRDRLQSALLESGVVRLSTSQGGRDLPAPQYVVSARVGGQEMAGSRASAGDYCVGGTRIVATADLRVRDATGAVAWGGAVSASVEVGAQVVAGQGAGGSCPAIVPEMVDGRRLATALALTAARRIAFRVSPLRVVAVDGRTLVLGHGGALVPLGAVVQVAGVDGAPVRYRVTASTPASASADPLGLPSRVAPGAVAEVIENDDPAANARRFTKVELP